LVFIISGLSVLALTQCQTEEVAIEAEAHNHNKTYTLTKQEATIIAGKLNSLLGLNKSKDKTLYQTQAITTDYGTVDYSKVIVVEEENGDKNYAFGIIDTEATANKFSNLILREDGDYNSVQVARYTMTDAFANDYLNNTRTIGEFEGDLSLVTIMNDNPCPPPDDSTPAAGGSSGGTGSSTSSPSAGNYTGGTTTVGGSGSGGSGTGGGTMRITCNNCSRTYGSYGAWQGSICATYDITVVISFGFSDNDGTDPNPCNDPVVLPLIEMSPNDIMLRNFFRNDLTQAQRLFLINNSTINTNVNQYLIANSINGVVAPDSIYYIKDVIDSYINNQPVVIGPDIKITDIVAFLNCINKTQPATISIYCLQPIVNNLASHDGTFVGHTFISITQGGNKKVIGFYPVSNWITPIRPSGTSVYGNDTNQEYNTSISTTVNPSQLTSIISYITTNASTKYNLNTYNCTDFGIGVGNLAGLNLPDGHGTWPGGAGSNPGALGQHIRGMTGNNSTTSTTNLKAPTSTNCP
jgi:hypothetical protein